MIIACTGNYRKSQFFNVVNSISSYFINNNLDIDIMLSNDFTKELDAPDLNKTIKVDSFLNCINSSDLVLSIGGDGTILSTIRRIGNNSIPVLGIHIGNLGFLAQATKENIDKALDCLVNKNYKIEARLLLEVKIKNNGNKTYYAFNDVVIDHGNSGRILKSRVYVNGSHINNYESDGIIINTPTGSTGYSLSSGGPIISPNLNVVNITPISSHSLSARPIVLSSDSCIDIKFTEKFNDAALTIDGQERVNLSKEHIISINKAPYNANLIILPFNNYISTLKEKLGWSGNSNNF